MWLYGSNFNILSWKWFSAFDLLLVTWAKGDEVVDLIREGDEVDESLWPYNWYTEMPVPVEWLCLICWWFHINCLVQRLRPKGARACKWCQFEIVRNGRPNESLWTFEYTGTRWWPYNVSSNLRSPLRSRSLIGVRNQVDAAKSVFRSAGRWCWI